MPDRLRRPTALLLAVLLLLTPLGCSEGKLNTAERTSFLFDTIISIKVWFDGDAESLVDGAIELCRYYDNLFDRNNPDSDIYRINSSEGQKCEINEPTAALLDLSLHYAELSEGQFDISCGRVTALWDFSAENPTVPDAEALAEALSTVGWQSVELDGCSVRVPEGTSLDAGGIAKGFIADRITDYLRENGAESAVINLGGNVSVLGSKSGQPFSVGIRSPFDPEGYAGILSVSDCSVVTAGSYQRFFEEDGVLYHHILDLSTGKPADTGLASVTVIAPDSADADALATVSFLKGVEEGIAFIDSLPFAEAIFITDSGEMLMTDGAADIYHP